MDRFAPIPFPFLSIYPDVNEQIARRAWLCRNIDETDMDGEVILEKEEGQWEVMLAAL